MPKYNYKIVNTFRIIYNARKIFKKKIYFQSLPTPLKTDYCRTSGIFREGDQGHSLSYIICKTFRSPNLTSNFKGGTTDIFIISPQDKNINKKSHCAELLLQHVLLPAGCRQMDYIPNTYSSPNITIN